jgi:hypothetical protein
LIFFCNPVLCVLAALIQEYCGKEDGSSRRKFSICWGEVRTPRWLYSQAPTDMEGAADGELQISICMFFPSLVVLFYASVLLLKLVYSHYKRS